MYLWISVTGKGNRNSGSVFWAHNYFITFKEQLTETVPLSTKEHALLTVQQPNGKFLLYDIEDGDPLSVRWVMIQEIQSPIPKFPPHFAKLRGEMRNDNSWFLEQEKDPLWFYSYDPEENCFEAYRLSNWYKDRLYFNNVKIIANFGMRFFCLAS